MRTRNFSHHRTVLIIINHTLQIIIIITQMVRKVSLYTSSPMPVAQHPFSAGFQLMRRWLNCFLHQCKEYPSATVDSVVVFSHIKSRPLE